MTLLVEVNHLAAECLPAGASYSIRLSYPKDRELPARVILSFDLVTSATFEARNREADGQISRRLFVDRVADAFIALRELLSVYNEHLVKVDLSMPPEGGKETS